MALLNPDKQNEKERADCLVEFNVIEGVENISKPLSYKTPVKTGSN